MSVVIIGHYPPPIGGITRHIQRLKEYLERSGIPFTIYSLGTSESKREKNVVPLRTKALLSSFLFHHYDHKIIHLNSSSSWILRVYFGLILCPFKGKKYVVTCHANDVCWPYAINYLRKSASGVKARLITWLVINSFKCADCVICTDSKSKDWLISKGVKPDRVQVIPTFIPPLIREEEIAEIPQDTWDFIDSHTPTISANASRIAFYNNQDLYGIDMCIDLCAKLRNVYPKVGLVFCLPQIVDYEYFDKMKQKVVEKGVENNFLFQIKPCQFYPILMKSDLFVRATNTDGYALSVAEAMYFKVPTVASDVGLRPKGTILFKIRDIGDFTLKVKGVLDNYERHKKSLEAINFEDNCEKIMKIYQRLGER